uniref:uncharacterized protein LOC105350635 n=1 Tax=Fragaria vesca subsp. vesca TaxID=101020 RepID=UPI0005CAF060|nr:PREDICTED: uncharacterized protein LOC105350635 [Fragaria vesca subsp. vesca]
MERGLKLSSKGDLLKDASRYRFMHEPRKPHMEAALRVVRYLKNTPGQDNHVFHERTRLIEMDCHYIRHKIQDGSVVTKHVSSSFQLADVFIKALGKDFFIPLIRKLGVRDIHSPT